MSPLSRRSAGGREPATSRGAAAIEAHVEDRDGRLADHHFHPRPSNRFAGPGPVETVALHELTGPPHWHLVTYGLSELHAKESPDRHRSGWGFELTFRVTWADGPPLWAVDFLASLAAYVWSGRHPFAAGDLVDLRGPIKLDSATEITAAMVVEDPVLGSLAGPFGRVQFLEVVGLTGDELELCRSWSTEAVREILERDQPLLVTDLDRFSIDRDPRTAAEVAERSVADRRSHPELQVSTLEWKTRRRAPVVQMGSGAAGALGPALRRELVEVGDTFSLLGDHGRLRFVAGAAPGWQWVDGGMEMTVPPDRVEAVAALFDGRTGWGHLDDWPGLRFRVVP